jgi:CRP-like cAMP-binding protein
MSTQGPYKRHSLDEARRALRQMDLLACVPDDALLLVARSVARHEFAPGQIIIVAGEPSYAAYLISEGLVRVFRLSPDGREQVLARLGPGHSFNTVPVFLENGTNHATVQAIEQTVLFTIQREALRRLVADCPPLAWSLLQDMAARLDHLTNLAEDLSLRSVRGRLARFLLDHAGSDLDHGRWTQEEIAASLGTVRDVVGRTLRSLADSGMLQISRQRITLLDRAGLEAEADK